MPFDTKVKNSSYLYEELNNNHNINFKIKTP